MLQRWMTWEMTLCNGARKIVVCGQKELQVVYDNISTSKMVKYDFKVL